MHAPALCVSARISTHMPPEPHIHLHRRSHTWCDSTDNAEAQEASEKQQTCYCTTRKCALFCIAFDEIHQIFIDLFLCVCDLLQGLGCLLF